ncbi:MAG TPA: YoaK family protein [Acidimicrobiales bacterium]|jgi:uncharacterized membrane protein YoaK (UPF0700 family)|nr:YoaK family protein [Acidimicrobiales bacterium]
MVARRRLPPLIVGIYLISCICGMLDAACFLGMGQVFAEIMTGNLVYLAFAIGTRGTGQSLPVLPYVIALGTFALGALVGGRLVRLPAQWGSHRIAFAVEWVALAAAAVATLIVHPRYHGDARFVVIGILAFGMGIQNAAVRKWGVPDLATNVMTLTMTGLITDTRLGGGDNHHAGRRSTSIGIFVASAVFGAFLVRYGVLWPLVAALVIFSVALPILLQSDAKDDPRFEAAKP